MLLTGQEAYDNWIRTRDKLLDYSMYAKGNMDHELSNQIDDDLRMHYDLFKESLRMAALIKYLEIDVSPKEEEVE